MTEGTTTGNTALSHADAESLRGTAKWARFLAIVGFVMIGLMVIAGLFAGSMMASMGSMMGGASDAQMEMMEEQMQALEGMEGMEGVDMSQQMEQYRNASAGAGAMSGAMFTFIFLLMAALYFFPTLLLYQFATKTLRALDGTMDATSLSAGLNSHRRFYKFMGILMIIVLSLYALIFIFALLGAAMM